MMNGAVDDDDDGDPNDDSDLRGDESFIHSNMSLGRVNLSPEQSITHPTRRKQPVEWVFGVIVSALQLKEAHDRLNDVY